MIRLTIATLACMGLTACGGVSLGVPGAGGVLNNPSGVPNVAPVEFPMDTNFASLINGYRDSVGAPDVTYNALLEQAAQGHADELLSRDARAMILRGDNVHLSADGRTEADRIRETGYVPVNFGENIAVGQQTDREVLQDWEDSASHDRLLRAATVDEFGLAVSGTGSNAVWVLVMASD